MSANKELFKKYRNNIFIETGSWHGDGIQVALDSGYKIIYSIELSSEFYMECTNRFRNNINVFLVYGNSEDMLKKILDRTNDQVTFWLDSHFCGPGTAQGWPLLKELDIIKNHYIKNHTLLIDDLRGWDKRIHGFDTYDLMKKIKEININYVFDLEDGYDPELNIIYPCDILTACL